MAVVALVMAIGLVAMPGTAGFGAAGGAKQPRVYGAVWQGSLGLVRLDPVGLRPLAGRRVPLSGEPLGWSFAPDRSRMILSTTARGARLRLIDLRAMRVLGDIVVARRGSGIATAWVGPRRVLAVMVTPGCCGAGDTIVAAIDIARRRVLWRQRLGGSLQAGERLDGSLLLVLGPRGRSVGPSRLVEVGAHGPLRSVALPVIVSGTQSIGTVTNSWEPGLAVDRAGGRAFVVQAGAPVAEVDLPTFAVRWQALEPAARPADTVTGATRDALWMGRGTLAITGSDRRATRGHGAAGRAARELPAGLTLVDTRRWSARTIDARATDAALVSDTLLASSFLFDARTQTTTGSGLSGYSVDGRRRFHRYGKQPITGVEPLGRGALVGGRTAITLIDARTARQLRRYRTFATTLINRDAPIRN
jgi:hypothetical protein